MNKVVQDTIDLWQTYSEKRETWAQHAQEDREFRLGKQWTEEQRVKLESRGQAPIVVNRIHPAVESAKAMITSNRPSFRVSPREDSDNQTAQAMNGLLQYVWQISEGESKLRTVVDDYYVTGLGGMLVYQDPMADMGKGEVKIKDIDSLDIYIDPNSRDKFCDDAENIIISRLFTKEQAKKMEPLYSNIIKKAQGDQLTDRPVTERQDDGELSFPEDVTTITAIGGQEDTYIRGYERYQKIIEKEFRIYEHFSGYEDVLNDQEIEEYAKMQAWVIQGQIITDPKKAQMLAQQLMQQYQMQMQQYQQYQQRAGQAGQIAPEMVANGADPQMPQYQEKPQEPQIEEITKAELITAGQIEVVTIPVWRIKEIVVMGDKLLYQRILPIERYPIILFMNLHTRTPYPTSDVRMVKNLQEYINKIRSLIIAHATTSTNTKILVPEGSVDMKEFEEKWAQPGVAIEYDPADGAPMPINPLPMPNELYKNEIDAKQDIDHQLGIYELMMGNSAAAPQTYKATISIDEFGQRKIRSKLSDIEAGLRRMGQVVIPLMQQLYNTEKIVRLIQPNNSMTEYMVNKRMYDDNGQVTEIINNLAVGKYDLIVVAGSTLPSNRYAQLEMYMDAYKNQIIDRVEVLKKTEIFDIEGVMQRTDETGQLKQALEQAQENIKKLEGDLQTREREVYHAKQQAELEKFKASLDSTSTKAKAAGTIYERRLTDSQRDIAKNVQESEQTRKKVEQEEARLAKEQKKIKPESTSKSR